jgi:hypothetical protein
VQEVGYLSLYDTSTGNRISCCLREKFKRYEITVFAREAQETPYIAVYKRSSEGTRSHNLREKHSKPDISPFTREV